MEVGVAFGDFSEVILKECRPSVFIGVYIFVLDRVPIMWGQRTSEILGGRSHYEYYADRFAREISANQVAVLKGDSVVALQSLPDDSVDILYVDADHSYGAVKQELDIASRIVRDDGWIILNDYTMRDNVTGEVYGVVQAANEFMLREGWEMTYLALEPRMFCDVVLRKLRA